MRTINSSLLRPRCANPNTFGCPTPGPGSPTFQPCMDGVCILRAWPVLGPRKAIGEFCVPWSPTFRRFGFTVPPIWTVKPNRWQSSFAGMRMIAAHPPIRCHLRTTMSSMTERRNKLSPATVTRSVGHRLSNEVRLSAHGSKPQPRSIEMYTFNNACTNARISHFIAQESRNAAYRSRYL